MHVQGSPNFSPIQINVASHPSGSADDLVSINRTYVTHIDVENEKMRNFDPYSMNKYHKILMRLRIA